MHTLSIVETFWHVYLFFANKWVAGVHSLEDFASTERKENYSANRVAQQQLYSLFTRVLTSRQFILKRIFSE
jgi:hypothetical protein